MRTSKAAVDVLGIHTTRGNYLNGAKKVAAIDSCVYLIHHWCSDDDAASNDVTTTSIVFSIVVAALTSSAIYCFSMISIDFSF